MGLFDDVQIGAGYVLRASIDVLDCVGQSVADRVEIVHFVGLVLKQSLHRVLQCKKPDRTKVHYPFRRVDEPTASRSPQPVEVRVGAADTAVNRLRGRILISVTPCTRAVFR
jgi:hypothetical protein